MSVRFTSAKSTRGAAASRPNFRYAWLAGPLLAAALAGCGQATAPATAAPAAVVAAPAAAPTPVVATKPAPTAAKAAPADTAAPKAAASARTYRRAAPEPLAVVATVVAPEPEPIAVPTTVAAPVAHMQSGHVLDENGRPMVGATILLKGSRKGTSTDANGNYSLEVPKGDNTFLIGYGGYQDETATAHDGQSLNVTLVPTPKTKPGRK